jgi:Bacterial Ig domain
MTFSLYSSSDSTCSKALRDVTVTVSGDGSYVSPPITPASTGSYQWVASYVGDEANSSVSAACDDPAERSTVAPPVCVRPDPAQHGVVETVGTSVSAYVAARGVKSVTFYLDGRTLATVTKAAHHRFSLVIDTAKLSFGVHRLTTKVTMRVPACASAEIEGTFIHVKPNSLPPRFAG